jgi:hypothetical protein
MCKLKVVCDVLNANDYVQLNATSLIHFKHSSELLQVDSTLFFPLPWNNLSYAT